MHRCCALVVVLAACGTTTDDRPETAQFITTSIVEPYCGRQACHSSATDAHNLALDTFAHTDDVFLNASEEGHRMVQPGDHTASELWLVITPGATKIMPPDYPLPDEDNALIARWIDAGAPGL
jgi:hypothetical protein